MKDFMLPVYSGLRLFCAAIGFCAFGFDVFAQADGLGPPAPAAPVIEMPAAALPVETMEAFHVDSARINASDVDGPDPIDHYDPGYIEGTGSFTLGQFLGTIPPSAAGNSQLVLIDGVPTNLDISSIPLGMIESVDVARDGSMPSYGAYTSGRVVNIHLKKDYNGTELLLQDTGTFEGGGGSREATLSGGRAKGKFRVMYWVNAAETEELTAAQRSFSSSQDYTDVGGQDFRIPWGFPAVVQAVNGNLAGLTDANGDPVTAAMVPASQNGMGLSPSEFLAASGAATSASGLRMFDTAPYLALISPSSRTSANFTLTYTPNSRLELSLNGSVSQSRSEQDGPPPVSPVSAATLVPAAYNPFGQDVEVGLVDTWFGPIREDSLSTTGNIALNLNGKLSGSWKWNAGIGFNRNDSQQSTYDLDQQKFSDALAAVDPAERFNPFTGLADDPANAALIPEIAVERTSETSSDFGRLDVRADGQVVQAWGGPVTVALGGNGSYQAQSSVVENAVSSVPPGTQVSSGDFSLFSTVTVPWVGQPDAQPWLRRLESQFSGQYSEQSDGGSSNNSELGLTLAPVKALLLRATYASSEQTPPNVAIEPVPPLQGQTYVDPFRTPSTVSNVELIYDDRSALSPETTARESLGVTFEPSFLTGLRFSSNYNFREQDDIVQESFNPQDVIDNEAAFPGRVIRGAPSAQDLALGQPGPITAVEISPGNAGYAESRDVDFSLEYRLPSKEFGDFRISAYARRVLDSIYDVAPGMAFIPQGGGVFNPPNWSSQGMLFWSHDGWNASTGFSYVGSTEAAANGGFEIRPYSTVDVNAGYEFRSPILGHFGKGVRVAVGVRNLLGEDPPFANTILGYQGGSPLGCIYTLSLSAPL